MEGNGVRVARLRGYLAADSGNSELACELLDLLLAQGAVGEADCVLSELPASTLGHPAVAFRQARCALASGRYAQAAQQLQGLIEGGADAPGIAHDLAFCQLCLRQPEHAQATVSQAITAHGASASLLILAARIALMQADHDQALAHADRALLLDPEDAQASGVRALALFDGNHLEQAAVAADAGLRRDPDQHESLLVAATLALWRRDAAAAERLYERALQRHPNSGRALSGQGQCAMMANDLPRAGSILEHAVQAMPGHIGTWHALAWTQLLQGQREAARGSFQQAYAIDRNFGDTHGGLALVAVLAGEHDEAEQSIQKALRLAPASITARYARSLLLEAQGDAKGAQALLSELLDGSGVTTLPVAEFSRRLHRTLVPH